MLHTLIKKCTKMIFESIAVIYYLPLCIRISIKGGSDDQIRENNH